jgi:hypothetical protein
MLMKHVAWPAMLHVSTTYSMFMSNDHHLSAWPLLISHCQLVLTASSTIVFHAEKILNKRGFGYKWHTNSIFRRKQSLSLSRNSLPFMEPKGSLPYSQDVATGLYPEPNYSCPYTHVLFSNIYLNIMSSHSILHLSSCLFPSGFLTKLLWYISHPSCPLSLDWTNKQYLQCNLYVTVKKTPLFLF